MNILHIACISGDMCNGVQVVVPQHLNAQGRHANVAFLNISNVKVECECEQFEYNKNFSIELLASPFNKPDMVVFHECYRIQYINIAKELLKLKIPYVIIPHGELSKNAQKKKYFKKKVANLLIFNRFINNATGVQLLSETELKNTRFGKRQFVGTNGINLPKKSKEHFHKSGFKFLYIGRLDVYHKGLDLMVESLSKCSDFLRANNCTLDIYGPDIFGRLAQVEKLVADNDVADIIKLHPPVFNEEKEKIILDADIFIQTSRFEGMPMGILEAMGYGLPCLVTEGTTLAEMINENGAGWGCEVDAAAIAEAIQEAVCSTDSFEKKSAAAIELVKNNFSWEHIAEDTLSVYKEITKNS